jgi:hypothetical protein
VAADLIMMPVTVTQVAGLCHAPFRDGTADVHFFVVVVQYARASRLFEVRWVVPPLNLGVLGQNYFWALARAASIGVGHTLSPSAELFGEIRTLVPSFRLVDADCRAVASCGSSGVARNSGWRKLECALSHPHDLNFVERM